MYSFPMKKHHLFILFLGFFAFGLSSFTSDKQPQKLDEPLYDTLHFQSLVVAGIKLGSPYGKVLEKLGSPDSVRKEATPDAQTADHFEEYLYGTDVLYVMDETFSGFELKTPRFQVESLGGLKVGDSASKLKKLFPISYKNREIDEFNPAWVTYSVQFGTSDSFLEIYTQDGKIITISTVTDDDEEEEE